jgi:hypothetical protein
MKPKTWHQARCEQDRCRDCTWDLANSSHHHHMRIFTSLSNTTSINKAYDCVGSENPLNKSAVDEILCQGAGYPDTS